MIKLGSHKLDQASLLAILQATDHPDNIVKRFGISHHQIARIKRNKGKNPLTVWAVPVPIPNVKE